MNKKSSFFAIFFFLLLFMSISGISFAGNASNYSVSSSTQNLSSNTTVIKSIINSTKITLPSNQTLNTTEATTVFNQLSSPILKFLYPISLVIFFIVLSIGEIIMYKAQLDKPTIEIAPFIEFLMISLLILIVPVLFSSYASVIPSLISSLGKANIIEGFVYETDAMIIIAVVISFAGFVLFLKAIIDTLIEYIDENKRVEARTKLIRIAILLLFIILSPYVLILVFLTLSHIIIIIDNSFNAGASQLLATTSLVPINLYQTSYTGCVSSPNYWQFGQVINCASKSIEYTITANAYVYKLQIGAYKTVISLITGDVSDTALNQLIFSLLFGIIMIFSFAMIDYKTLKYLESLSTENEQESFRELKARYVQFSMFALSPVLYIVFLIIVNGLITAIVGMLFYSSTGSISFSPIPALFALIGLPTTSNIIISIAGIIGLIFLLLLLAIIGIFAIIKIVASGIFSASVYLYFSDAPHVKEFGKRLLVILTILFVFPVIILFAYSIFFGLFPSIINATISSGTTITTGNSYGFELSGTGSLLTLKGSGLKSPYTLSCNSQSQVESAEIYLDNSSNVNNPQNALGVLLYGCQNFITTYALSVLVVDIIALVALILLIFFAIHGSGVSFAGLGSAISSGDVSKTFGIVKEGTSKVFEQARSSSVGKAVMNIPKQTYNYTKQPLKGTKEGAILEGAVASVGSFAKAVPQAISKNNEERNKTKRNKMANNDFQDKIKGEYGNYTDENGNLTKNGEEKLRRQLREQGLNDEEIESFINKNMSNGKLNDENIKSTINKLLNSKDENERKLGEKLANTNVLKARELLDDIRKNPDKDISEILSDEKYGDFGSKEREDLETRRLAYKNADIDNIKNKDERNTAYNNAVSLRNNKKKIDYDIDNKKEKDINAVNNDSSLNDEEKQQKISKINADAEKEKANAINELIKEQANSGFSGKGLIEILANSDNMADNYDTIQKINGYKEYLTNYANTIKNKDEKAEQIKSANELATLLNKSASDNGYSNVEEYINEAKDTSAYKMANTIRGIKNAKTENERQAMKNQFIDMLSSMGMDKKDVENIEQNNDLQNSIMKSIERMTNDNSNATQQEFMGLIQNGYDNLANPLIAKIATIPKGIVSNTDENLKAMIANPMNETFNEYFGSVKKLVNTTWSQLTSGTYDDMLEQLGKENLQQMNTIMASQKFINDNRNALKDSKLSALKKKEISEQIEEKKREILKAEQEIRLNNRTSDIYNKLPVLDSLLTTAREWNVASLDDVVSQYKMQGKIVDNQISTLNNENKDITAQLKDLDNRIKNATDSSIEVALKMQSDKLKEKLLKTNRDILYLTAQEKGINSFIKVDEIGVSTNEINDEATKISIKKNINNEILNRIQNDKEVFDKIKETDKLKELNRQRREIQDILTVSKTIDDVKKNIDLDSFSNEIKNELQKEIEAIKTEKDLDEFRNKFEEEREKQEKDMQYELQTIKDKLKDNAIESIKQNMDKLKPEEKEYVSNKLKTATRGNIKDIINDLESKNIEIGKVLENTIKNIDSIDINDEEQILGSINNGLSEKNDSLETKEKMIKSTKELLSKLANKNLQYEISHSNKVEIPKAKTIGINVSKEKRNAQNENPTATNEDKTDNNKHILIDNGRKDIPHISTDDDSTDNPSSWFSWVKTLMMFQNIIRFLA